MPDASATFERVADELSVRPGVARGKMFGVACIKVGGKAFATFHEGAMVFKLAGEERAQALQLDGGRLWDPSGEGRKMKEWVQVPEAHQEHWEALAEQALAYVASLSAR